MRTSYPQQIVDEVRIRNDIVEVISEYVSLKQSGENFKGLCPFHAEKTPSFVVSPVKQLFHCFGCGVGGNVFHFLMRHGNLSFPETVLFLAQRVGMNLPRSQRGERNEGGEREKEFYRLNEAVADYYHHILLYTAEGKRGRVYLQKRGISEKVLKTFRLGYAPRRWDSLVKTLTMQKGFAPSLLQSGGLIKPRNQGQGYYDIFRDRIIFPIHDLHDRVVAFGGRAIDDSQLPKYLNSPETPVYKKGATLYGLHAARQAMRRAGYALVVEGYFDLLAVWQAGIENVVAPLGTALTKRQIQLLRNYTQEIMLVFDNDQSGKAAAERGSSLLLDEEMRVRVVTLPTGSDPDTVIRTQGGEAFRQILQRALPFVEHLIRMGEQEWSSIEEKMRHINALLPLIAKIANHVERMEYLALLAEKTKVSAQALQREFQKFIRREPSAKRATPVSVTSSSSTLGEKELIQLMLEDPSVIAAVREEVSAEDFADAVLGELACFLFALDEKGAQVTPSQLLDLLPHPQWKERVSQLLMRKTPVENRAQLLRDYLSVMRGRRIKQQVEAVKAQAEEAEKRGDSAESDRLLQQFMVLQRALRGQGNGGKDGGRLVQKA